MVAVDRILGIRAPAASADVNWHGAGDEGTRQGGLFFNLATEDTGGTEKNAGMLLPYNPHVR
jgi:hypothetical protein